MHMVMDIWPRHSLQVPPWPGRHAGRHVSTPQAEAGTPPPTPTHTTHVRTRMVHGALCMVHGACRLLPFELHAPPGAERACTCADPGYAALGTTCMRHGPHQLQHHAPAALDRAAAPPPLEWIPRNNAKHSRISTYPPAKQQQGDGCHDAIENEGDELQGTAW